MITSSGTAEMRQSIYTMLVKHQLRQSTRKTEFNSVKRLITINNVMIGRMPGHSGIDGVV